jgi:hypothetical protein
MNEHTKKAVDLIAQSLKLSRLIRLQKEKKLKSLENQAPKGFLNESIHKDNNHEVSRTDY